MSSRDQLKFSKESTTTEISYINPNGKPFTLILEKMDDYYNVVELNRNTTNQTEIKNRLKRDLHFIKYFPDKTSIIQYLSIYTVLLYFNSFYSEYLTIVSFLESVIKNFFCNINPTAAATTTVPPTNYLTKSLVNQCSVRLTKIINVIEKNSKLNVDRKKKFFVYPKEFLSALKSAELFCKQILNCEGLF